MAPGGWPSRWPTTAWGSPRGPAPVWDLCRCARGPPSWAAAARSAARQVAARWCGPSCRSARVREFWRRTVADQPVDEPIRVVVADDHPVYREGLATLLSSVPGVQVVGT